jgi:selenocysteine lyase/cysteine desulfurase
MRDSLPQSGLPKQLIAEGEAKSRITWAGWPAKEQQMDLSRRDFFGVTATAAIVRLGYSRQPRLHRRRDAAQLVNKRTRLISVAWINNNSGYRHDMKALAALAHANGAYLYSDAVQFIGTGPVDLHAEGVDFCTSGGYKWLMAGFGVAPFYVRRELLDTLHPSNVGWRSPSGANRSASRTSAKQLEDAAKILESERVTVSTQDVTPPDPATASGFPTRVRVAISFFNNEADVDRMLDVASKLTAS